MHSFTSETGIPGVERNFNQLQTNGVSIFHSELVIHERNTESRMDLKDLMDDTSKKSPRITTPVDHNQLVTKLISKTNSVAIVAPRIFISEDISDGKALLCDDVLFMHCIELFKECDDYLFNFIGFS